MGILEILGLNLGNLNVSDSLGQRSALCNDAVLHRRSPVLVPRDEDVVGLRESVITARNIVEETIDVPTPELEDILAKLRDLESQVEDLLGDDGDDAVEVTTTTENAQSESEPAPAANNGEAGNNIDSDGNDQQEAENENAGSPDTPEPVAGNGVFKQKVQVETEVVTSTMNDMTSTTTMTRTMTETVTMQSEPEEPTTEAAPDASSTSESETEPSVTPPEANVRLGAAVKEADKPFSASNATAAQLNAEKPSKIPGNLVDVPPTSMPVPVVKQFHQALYTNSSASSGFQTVTLPGAQ